MIYSINEGRIPICKKKSIDIEAIYNEGSYIKDCSFLISESMIIEYNMEKDIIRQAAILEGAKLDLMIKNWMKEGKDYKGLKKDVKELVALYDIDKSELSSKGKGCLHLCKRIIQTCLDVIGAISGAGATVAAGLITSNSLNACFINLFESDIRILTIAIIALAINFIINRIFRYIIDKVEFSNIKNDAEDIVIELRAKAKKTDDEKTAKKLNDEADKLEASIKKYSK